MSSNSCWNSVVSRDTMLAIAVTVNNLEMLIRGDSNQRNIQLQVILIHYLYSNGQCSLNEFCIILFMIPLLISCLSPARKCYYFSLHIPSPSSARLATTAVALHAKLPP